jgi:XTP/dITP diphosphohydrolase
MRDTPDLLVATTNRGKLHEIAALLGDLPIRLITPAEIGLVVSVAETGTTYADNARLKAVAFARAAGLVALGDDSGLEVDALGGAPGLHTARYAGLGASDADRYNLLLRRLAGVPRERRTARFRCAVAVASPGGEVKVADGVCEGRIAFQPAGAHGFGYDPVFFLDEYGCTMAELPDEVKNTISHRARALRAARPLIRAALRL